MTETRVLIMGAAGRDFHDFNVVYRGREDVEVVAFTSAPSQNLGETDEGSHERYPPELSGEGYPEGIPIEPESRLESIVREEAVDEVVFSYSDVSHEHVMHAASRAEAAGADFRLIGPDSVMLELSTPVLAIDAVRTGCGKSAVSTAFAAELRDRGVDVAVVREPMPYGDLVEQRVQRFETMADLDDADATIEEREEYEQHLQRGHTVFAGVDYEAIFEAASAEAELLLWDGGNNELPFARPDFHLVLVDPLRPGHEISYHPGETNLRLADAVLVTKVNAADDEAVAAVERSVAEANPDAPVYHTESVVTAEEPELIEGARVLVVEDGPTLTHGGTDRGAGAVAAEKYGAAALIDPRPAAKGSIAETLERYDHLEDVVPAMGYTDRQVADLERTIRAADPDVVVAGTPHDLRRQVDVEVPIVRAHYRLEPTDVSFGGLLDDHAEELEL